MPKISIIIPIYNTEQYLHKCLQSLVNQSLSEIEIICINDGSTDKSLNILYEFQKKDNRIKIINQSNEGVSSARNKGVSIANGEYILFVDSDDYINTDACKILYNKAIEQDFDVVMYRYCNICKNKIKPINFKVFKKNNNIHPKTILQGIFVQKLYKNSFLKKHNILFPIGHKASEDFCFTCIVYCHNPKVTVIQKVLYFYNNNVSSSATKNWDSRIENDVLSYNYFISSEAYNSLDTHEKLFLTDEWAKIIFGCWSTMPVKELQKKYDKVASEFLSNYDAFKDLNYRKMMGYKRLKYKRIVKLLKSIRNLIHYHSFWGLSTAIFNVDKNIRGSY